jgi:hypothetical protein
MPYLAKPRGEQDDCRQDAECEERLQRAAAQLARLKLVGELCRRRARELDVG